ncbi:putative disease resistance RPP13 protein [Trifolium repens]|jgi:hypothetical protein|nr:putative disease resistance RPP13 protein [Trifolium repens]KAK2415684.1 putative disease resistance RPP13 protein [Trifolium repens]
MAEKTFQVGWEILPSLKWCISASVIVNIVLLGQLSSLKDLGIDGMRILKSIGPKFYGMVGEGSNSSCKPFPFLQNLQIIHRENEDFSV